MTEDNTRAGLSRRQVLAGLGTIGFASVGAGVGTTAFLRDEESFARNTLAAGNLDLKLDWEEHYYRGGATAGLANDVVYTGGDPGAVPEGYVGLPTSESPAVAVALEDLPQFMDNTAIEAYPDVDDDGVQDPFAAEPGATTADGVGYICADGADADDLDPTAAGSWRTLNEDTYDADTETAKPLFALEDVKPGDFGELTLSYHLCDNPGFIWLDGALLENSENGFTEPERNHSTDTPGPEGELLDAIRTRIWYDDGDNVEEVGGEDPAWLTPEQSLRDLLASFGEDGMLLCPGGGTDGGIESCPTESDYDSVHTTGDTVTVDTDDGPTTIEIPKNPKCSDLGLVQAVKTDEAPEGPLPQSGTKTYNTPYGAITVTTDVVDGAQTITDWSIDSENRFCIAKVLVKGGPDGGNVYSYDNGDGDDDFTNDSDVGSQGDADTALRTPGEGDYDISHVSFCLSTGTGDGCCFEPSTDHYLGLAWWVPTDVGNEIQSDSVAFNLGLRTVQCRHSGAAFLGR